MTMITPSYLGETIEYSSLHACRSTLEDPTALTLGASAAQPGTVFLNCGELPVPSIYRDALRAARETDRRVTRTLSDRHARGLVNEFMRRLEGCEGEVPPYPVQNGLTSEIRKAAARRAGAGPATPVPLRTRAV